MAGQISQLPTIAAPLSGSKFELSATGTITGVTNANPAVVTSTAHGLATGQVVNITGVGGATGVNGAQTITVLTANTFSVPVAAGGAYTSGGLWLASVAFAVGGVAQTANNLSDLASAPTSRANLGIGTRATFSNANATMSATTKYLAQTGTMSAARTVTLPACSSLNAGEPITIADESGTVTSSNKITITAAGSDTIDLDTSVVLAGPYGTLTLVPNGVSKFIVGGLPSPIQSWLSNANTVNNNYTVRNLYGNLVFATQYAATALTISDSVSTFYATVQANGFVSNAASYLFTLHLAATSVVSFGNSGNNQFATVDTQIGRAGVSVLDFGNGSGAGATVRSVPLPVTISADQTDWNPGVARSYFVTTTGGTPLNINSLGISQVSGQECTFYLDPASTTSLIIKNAASSGTAANKFRNSGGADITLTLGTNESVTLLYDSTNSRWRAK